jgi:hypothetical protein
MKFSATLQSKNIIISNTTMNLFHLPPEIITCIYQYLGCWYDLTAFGLTCKQAEHYLTLDSIWYFLARVYVPLLQPTRLCIG